ncbi:hypothetical protein DXN05_14370 [Deminuibacter soli]|uniref:Uncharacterized protein n=1 Tax=Deminuibacter soli TaxID=2291815 RepID=A0A3E1NJ72_9BACT|nr:hypothetical protein DXN05_14370 [Deminuibacter soli]
MVGWFNRFTSSNVQFTGAEGLMVRFYRSGLMLGRSAAGTAASAVIKIKKSAWRSFLFFMQEQ